MQGFSFRPPRAAVVAILLGWALVISGCTRGPAHLVSRPQDPAPAILIRNVALLDTQAGEIRSDQDVLIRGEYIAEIGPGGSLAGPPDAEIIDGTGKTLIPGLVDAHAHVLSYLGVPGVLERANPERNLESFLYCGVTTVFDTGESTDEIFSLRDRIDRGQSVGPRLYIVGKTITAPDGHPVKMIEALAPWWIRWYIGPRIALEVDTETEARSAVEANEAAGADFIKVVVDTLPGNARRIDPEILEAVVEESHERGLRVVAHIGSTQDALAAGNAGVDAYVHGVYLNELEKNDVQAITGFGIPMMPTTIVFENAANLNHVPFSPTSLEREVAPPKLLETYDEKVASAKIDPQLARWLNELREIQPAWDENVRRLHEAGVTLMTGSDFQPGLFPGPSVHREIDLLERAGLSPAEVLRAATLHPARFLTGSDDPEFGSVSTGKRADLVLIKGNPLENLAAVHEIRDVILGGVRLIRTGYPVSE